MKNWSQLKCGHIKIILPKIITLARIYIGAENKDGLCRDNQKKNAMVVITTSKMVMSESVPTKNPVKDPGLNTSCHLLTGY